MYTGLTGALKIADSIFGPATVAYISGWSLEDKTEVIETTKLGCVDKGAFTGFKSWSASADGTIVLSNEDCQEELFKAKLLGTEITLGFYLNDKSDNSSTYFEGRGYIETLNMDLSAGDKGNVSISVRGTGSLRFFVGGRDIAANVPRLWDEYFRLKINEEDGCLYARIPDGLQNNISIEDGYFILKV